MRVPQSTYRLQLNEQFTLEHARGIVPYLARLGVSDLYLSPVFEARPGSTHGYDVTDPTRVRQALGGEDALRALAEAVQRHDMGILLDIVPNHMAASTDNPWWRDMLQHGRHSQYAGFFDVDWGTADDPSRLRLPILGDSLENLVQKGEVTIDAAAGEAVYFETRLPLARGTASPDRDALRGPDNAAAVLRILERQHYELVFWRTASESMSYRRFFDITDLAGVRVEDDDVFAATHSLIRSLAADGTITGLRIDHIDGLRDPTRYLHTLRERVRGPGGEPVYTVVEKILEHDEALPEEWDCEGTTGYEFLNMATGMLLDGEGYRRLEEFYLRLTGDAQPFSELVRDKKLLVMERLFGSELNGLARKLVPLIGVDEALARRSVAELSASMRVYRTYTRSRRIRDDDRLRVDEAAEDSASRNPDLAAAIELLRQVVLLERVPVQDATLDWVMRWQQFTGPVMAKGFEDTALYCHNALLAANEVGSNPVNPDLSVGELHALLRARQERSPRSLNTTATHDTKRGEDTRARIAVLSEIPDEWRPRLRRWVREGEEWKNEIAEDDDTAVPEADVDSLLYQTLVGAWPLHGADATFTERIKAYMTKAVREAKQQTSWRRPDEDFEQGLDSFVDMLMAEFGREGLAESVAELATRVAPHGALNSLAQTLFRITAPGIPDTYQGTELWSYTLVDPDNRQPVDYEERQRLLAELQPLLDSPDPLAVRELLDQWQDGRIKLLFTTLALRFRSRHADLFDRGRCLAVSAEGARAEHVIAHARELDGDACIVILPRWTTRLADGTPHVTGRDVWVDTQLTLPSSLGSQQSWRNALTGQQVAASGGRLEVAAVFGALPFALLERE
jgi:(1->4)-alpha-D-glucan 1-alpha-D-glucosylmutase